MIKPDLRDSFSDQDDTIEVEWFDLRAGDDLPDLNWQQVYAVAKLEKKIPVVLYEDGSVNLPGGKAHPGESIGQTLHRELLEELNCRVLRWKPIGYQKVFQGVNGEFLYQLRVYAELEKLGEFEEDPGGGVTGYRLIELDELNTEIHYGKVGDRIMQLVRSDFSN